MGVRHRPDAHARWKRSMRSGFGPRRGRMAAVGPTPTTSSPLGAPATPAAPPRAVTDAELDRALADPDPAASYRATHRPARPRIHTRSRRRHPHQGARHRTDRAKAPPALPGDRSLRNVVWEFMHPMLSPGLAALTHDTFIIEEHTASTVDLDAQRAPSDLDELDLEDLLATPPRWVGASRRFRSSRPRPGGRSGHMGDPPLLFCPCSRSST